MSLEERRKRAHAIIQAAMEEAGIVDYCYCGVDIDGKDLSAFVVGNEDRTEYSNVDRMHKMIGIVDCLKVGLVTHFFSFVLDDKEEDTNV